MDLMRRIGTAVDRAKLAIARPCFEHPAAQALQLYDCILAAVGPMGNVQEHGHA